MKIKSIPILFAAILGLLLAGMALLVSNPVQAASTATAADRSLTGDNSFMPTTVYTVYSAVLSNEPPGYLVDYLIAQGHGSETLLQVLGYLRAQSNGIISDEFYNQVAAAPAGSEVFTAFLSNYAGLIGGIEICADGAVSIPSEHGRDYVGASGYGTEASQDRQFTLTYAQDTAHYIYTHTQDYGGLIRDYYFFAVAWRGDYLYLPQIMK